MTCDGLWRNAEGSCVFLRSNAIGIEGWYATRVGADEALGKRHPLVGFAEGDLVGFVVAWRGAQSITSWTGRIVAAADGARTLHTLWHLARAEKGAPPTPTALWETYLTNASIFTFETTAEPTETSS